MAFLIKADATVLSAACKIKGSIDVSHAMRMLSRTSCIRQNTTREPVAPSYDPQVIESKWASLVTSSRTGNQDDKNGNREKFYALSMFPYPSGLLHMGHVRVYTICDTVARFRALLGYQVIHPMGWDAFGKLGNATLGGLPAENAAVERGIEPSCWTESNIAAMKQQMLALGLKYDWDRSFATSEPEYYKWTQWLFTKLHAAGLAYRKEACVNWDPVDKTVLANEQVGSDGKSWRSGAIVEKRVLKQWFLGITSYADRLVAGLDALDGWPTHVVDMQRQWIGRSEGFEFNLALRNDGSDADTPGDSTMQECRDKEPVTHIAAYTTRAETVFGVSFVAVALDHDVLQSPRVPEETLQEIHALRDLVTAREFNPTRSTMSGESVDTEHAAEAVFTGLHVTHPYTGEALPVYAAAYVLSGYGTGAVMGVPAHDERDWALATAHGLPIKQVIVPSGGAATGCLDMPYTLKEGCLVNSEQFTGIDVKDAVPTIEIASRNLNLGQPRTNYRLHDWLVSRQRYWGTPIPMVECSTCGDVAVPEDQLPVVLPDMHGSSAGDDGLQLTGSEHSPLATLESWVTTPCPQCGAPDARRCTDTMDTFVDSSWYYLRYLDAQNTSAICEKEAAGNLPVDLYVGGIEHAVLHLFFARFMSYFMHDIGIGNREEPFQSLLTQGMVHGRTLVSSSTGKWLTPGEVSHDSNNVEIETATGEPVTVLYAKMSKSKYNGVDPADIIAKYGADTARVFMLFKAPPSAVLTWDSDSIQGVYRWLVRVWSLVNDHVAAREKIAQSREQHVSTVEKKSIQSVEFAMHETIRSVTNALQDKYSFNTAISDLMKLSNVLRSEQASVGTHTAFSDALRSLIVMLSPAAPHLGAELWSVMSAVPASNSFASQWTVKDTVFDQKWPIFDESVLVKDTMDISVQIAGKFRGSLSVPMDIASSDEELTLFFLSSDLGKKWLPDQSKITKVVIPQSRKMIGFVLRK